MVSLEVKCASVFDVTDHNIPYKASQQSHSCSSAIQYVFYFSHIQQQTSNMCTATWALLETGALLFSWDSRGGALLETGRYWKLGRY